MAINSFPAKGGIPSGNTAARPGGPVTGDTFYNGQLEILEIYNGTAWVAVSAPPSTPQITSVTDASTGDAYTSTAGKLAVVFVAGSGGGTPSQYNAFTVAGGHSASSSSTTVTLTGLTPGTSYEVYGNGQNNFGTTVNSPNQAAVTPTTLPEVRTIGAASTSSATSDVTVTWSNGNNGGKNLTSITITPFLNGTTAQTSQNAATTSSTTHTFTGLTANSSYTFKVKATNANGTCADSTATNSVTIPLFIDVDYLVLAGGASGGSHQAGGGGAGGLRSTVTATGGGGSLETAQKINKNTNYTVTVGAGGALVNGGANAFGNNGANSVFGSVTATGGGGGGGYYNVSGGGLGQAGGSGGGGASSSSGGTQVNGSRTSSPVQGNNGGLGYLQSPHGGGGGGGAGAAGSNANQGGSGVGGNGGNGVAISITGSSVTYGGGGGGSGWGGGQDSSPGSGGSGGGGAGANGANTGSAATANTGGGGGGSASGNVNSGAGGSGIVILRWLTSGNTLTVGAGLTADATGTDGSYSYKRFTAGSGNVSFS